MRPEDMKLSTNPRGQIQPPQRSHMPSQQAAANLTRQQIDTIYGDQARQDQQDENTTSATNQNTTAAQNQSQSGSAYSRTHKPAHSVHANQWQQYHSAWQDYYQKYYEHYYMGAVSQVHQAYTQKAAELQANAGQNNSNKFNNLPASDETISKDEAIYDLRNSLVDTVRDSGKKVRKSRHFMPLVAALSVLMLFVGMQYNRVIIANVKAYVTPGEIDPQNIVVDPNASLSVGKDPRIIIPKINVNAPIVYNTDYDQASQLKAMEKGVAYFGIPGANSKPGQVGNTVLSGHSSNDFIDDGQYKFVFALLERLKQGDIFYLHYKGIRYTYTVTKTDVVLPNDVRSLIYPTSKPIVTLITCTPLGTSQKRLLVTAEQISPSPSVARAAPKDSGSESKNPTIPGNSPTILERIIGR